MAGWMNHFTWENLRNITYIWMNKGGRRDVKRSWGKNIRIILINKTHIPQGKTWLLVKVSAGRKVEAKVNTPVSSTAEKYSSIRLHPGTQERNLGASSDSPFRSFSSKVPLVVLLFQHIYLPFHYKNFS